jgi:hypothetical protein
LLAAARAAIQSGLPEWMWGDEVGSLKAPQKLAGAPSHIPVVM